MHLATYIIAFGIGFAGLFSLIGSFVFLLVKPPVRSFYTSLYLFLFSLWLLLTSCASVGLKDLIPFNIFTIGLIFCSAAIPFTHFDFRKRLDPSFKLTLRQLPHALGPLFFIVYAILFHKENAHIYTLLSYEELFYHPPGNAFFSFGPYFLYLFYFIEISFSLFHTRVFYIEGSPTPRATANFSRASIVLNMVQTILWVIDRFFCLGWIWALYLISGFFIVIGFFLVIKDLNFIFSMDQKPFANAFNSGLNSFDEKKVRKRIEQLITREMIYRDEKLDLERFAKEIGITSRDLSSFIKICYKKNFSSYINFFRVEEAKKKLLSDPDNPVENVGFEAGFNSASSFYRVFKQETGLSPADYRKNNI